MGAVHGTGAVHGMAAAVGTVVAAMAAATIKLKG